MRSRMAAGIRRAGACIGVLCTLTGQVDAGEPLKIYYRMNESSIDSGYVCNKAALSEMDSLLRRASDGYLLDSVAIRGYASPDGRPDKNRELAGKRAAALGDMLFSRPGWAGNIPVSYSSGPVSWETLADTLRADASLPYREEVLDILTGDDSHERKQFRLSRLRQGAAYHYLSTSSFPKFRYSSCQFYYRPPRATEIQPDTVVRTEPPARCGLPADTLPPVGLPVRGWSRWRLTTNLLYWAALAHNVGIEYAINDHGYLSLNGACAWWSRRADYKAYRWMVGELAYMYCFRPGLSHAGFQLGAYAQTGEFELMNGPKNRKGEFTAGGVCAAYRWRVRKRSAIHAELGLGYMYIDYRYAVPMNGRLIYQGRNYVHYWGPTRASLSWIYYFKTRR